MSLINDALRRAQQQQAPSNSGAGMPPLRPVEPRRSSSGGGRWVLVLFALLFLGGAAWALWVGSRQGPQSPPSPAPTEVQTVSHHPPPIPIRTDNGAKPAPTVAPVVQTNTVIVVVTNVVAAIPTATNPPPPPPVFPTLKLHGIFYLPSNPSVMINGQTLYVNDEIEKAKVVAITKTSVTVVWAGQTNVMMMR